MTVTNMMFHAFEQALTRNEVDPREADFEVQLGLGTPPPLDILRISNTALHSQILVNPLTNVSVVRQGESWALIADDVFWPTKYKIEANYAVVYVKDTRLPVSLVDFGQVVSAIGSPPSVHVPQWYKFWQKPRVFPGATARFNISWDSQGVVSWPVHWPSKVSDLV